LNGSDWPTALIGILDPNDRNRWKLAFGSDVESASTGSKARVRQRPVSGKPEVAGIGLQTGHDPPLTQ
jgi:hypothetical protein